MIESFKLILAPLGYFLLFLFVISLMLGWNFFFPPSGDLEEIDHWEALPIPTTNQYRFYPIIIDYEHGEWEVDYSRHQVATVAEVVADGAKLILKPTGPESSSYDVLYQRDSDIVV